MNKAYKSIYNESTGTFVAVAENVQSRCNQTQLKRAQAAFGCSGRFELSD